MYSFSMDPPQPLPPHSEGTPIVVMTGIPKVKAEQLAQVWQNSPKSRWGGECGLGNTDLQNSLLPAKKLEDRFLKPFMGFGASNRHFPNVVFFTQEVQNLFPSSR